MNNESAFLLPDLHGSKFSAWNIYQMYPVEASSKCCKLKMYFTIKVYICTILFWMSCSNLANGSNNFLENFLTWELNTCRSWTSWTLFLLQILTNAIISSSTRYIKYTNSHGIKNNPVVCAWFIKVTLIYINYKGTRHKT